MILPAPVTGATEYWLWPMWLEAELRAELFGQGPPLQLFHYTNCASAEKILRSGELRATGIRHLDDPIEYFAGLDICWKALREVRPSLRPFLREAVKGLSESFQTDVFVTSFSDSPLIASNWHDYGDRGRGFALALETTCLSDLAGVWIRPVEYDADRQYEQVRRALLSWEDDVLRATAIGCEFAASIGSRTVMLSAVLFYQCCSFKNGRRWAHQREWRIVYTTSEVVNRLEIQRDGNGKPFVLVPLGRLYHEPKPAFAAVIEGPEAGGVRARSLRRLAEMRDSTLKYLSLRAPRRRFVVRSR